MKSFSFTLWFIDDLPRHESWMIFETIDHWNESIVNVRLQFGIIIEKVLGVLLPHQSTIPKHLEQINGWINASACMTIQISIFHFYQVHENAIGLTSIQELPKVRNKCIGAVCTDNVAIAIILWIEFPLNMDPNAD